MGADFCLTYVQVDCEDRDELNRRIDAMTIGQLRWLAELTYDDYRDDFEMAENMRARLRAAVEEVLFQPRRDVAMLILGNVTYHMTGGMSWGDDPTEAYQYVLLLGESGITLDKRTAPGEKTRPPKSAGAFTDLSRR